MKAITATNIGKKYDIQHSQGRYITLRDSLITTLLAPVTFVKGLFSTTLSVQKKEAFWALQGLNFTINKGEVIGVIGHNGAGKSTLLKILSQITPPTTGEITINGRVGSLLEVGTGFHPELSGRENIFLNGAILGMKRKEIAEKFNAIVEFADIEKFLDTPVKYYSSGMYVRLAFSVAAHMDPDILIIDEVLAVGDAAFQKKSLGKMDEITKKDGRTILFVSHNMSAIKQLCTTCMLLDKGQLKKIGPTADVIEEYLGLDSETEGRYSSLTFTPDENKKMEITAMKIVKDGTTPLVTEKDFSIELSVVVREAIESVFLSLLFFDQHGHRCADFMEIDSNEQAVKMRQPGTYIITVTIPGFFNAGIYDVMALIERGQETLDKQSGLLVKINDTKPRIYPIQGRAPIIAHATWK